MKLIPLSQGKFAKIDDADFEPVSQYKWHYHKGYAYTKSGALPMHRFLIGTKKGYEVDHINVDSLDNRRSNLRFVTRAENMANRRPYRLKRAVGASWNKVAHKWQAQKTLTRNGKRLTIYLGLYPTKELATAAFDKWHRDNPKVVPVIQKSK